MTEGEWDGVAGIMGGLTERRDTITVDAVTYTRDQLREIIRERHTLAAELRLVRDTLAARSRALNRTSEALEWIRSQHPDDP